MVKKSFLLITLSVFIFLTCGCTLIKGTGGAVGGAAVGCAQGASEGFRDDVSFIKKADNWIKDNLW
ncbi:MAG: hypothetical protein Q8N80_04225 [Candidatus Omnitrophota bacterium]|nr:hypothetical protein [Candidatus Omnitrophota bacterium]